MAPQNANSPISEYGCWKTTVFNPLQNLEKIANFLHCFLSFDFSFKFSAFFAFAAVHVKGHTAHTLAEYMIILQSLLVHITSLMR